MIRYALCVAAVLVSGTANAVLINEFEPNPAGSDPATTTVELLGNAGDAFSGWILTVDTDFAPGSTVDRASAVSGTFDSSGLLTASVPDFENPSFTILVVDAFTGSLGDVLDSVDDLVGLGIGTVYDAINTPDASGDESNSIAADLGGTDLAYTGDEPKLIFRDSTDPSIIYSINDPAGTDAIDQDGVAVAFTEFDLDPEASTFGRINPTAAVAAIPEPTAALFGSLLAGALGLTVARRR